MAENHSDNGVVAIVRMFLAFLKDLLGEFANRLNILEIKMAKIEEVQAAQAAADEALSAALARVKEDIDGQAAEIQALKDQIAAGGTVTEAQLDPILERAQSFKAKLDALDPVPNSPAGPAE